MASSGKTGLAIVGCGFVADYYLATLERYPDLRIVGVYDKDAERLNVFCEFFKLEAYASLNALLNDEKVDIVLNLTNPRAHFEISMQCLEANKHVYSEKPLAMNFDDAEKLVNLAKSKRLKISSAPCSALGKASQTLAHAVKENVAGDIKLVYAELDDGLVHKMAYKKWFSESGAPWPYRDEFEVGCTLEHAGYVVSWFMRMFGPIRTITAFSDCVIQNKVEAEAPLEPTDAADISFGLLKFESGVVVRLSTTIVAPHDHAIKMFGDKGVLYLNECWDNSDPVYFRTLMHIRRKTFLSPWRQKIKLPYDLNVNKMDRGNTKMDFLLGVKDLADSLKTGKPNILNEDFSLHVNEAALALQYAGTNANTYHMKSRFRLV